VEGQKDEGAELKGGEDGQWGCEPLEVGLLRMAFTLRIQLEVIRIYLHCKCVRKKKLLLEIHHGISPYKLP